MKLWPLFVVALLLLGCASAAPAVLPAAHPGPAGLHPGASWISAWMPGARWAFDAQHDPGDLPLALLNAAGQPAAPTLTAPAPGSDETRATCAGWVWMRSRGSGVLELVAVQGRVARSWTVEQRPDTGQPNGLSVMDDLSRWNAWSGARLLADGACLSVPTGW